MRPSGLDRALLTAAVVGNKLLLINPRGPGRGLEILVDAVILLKRKAGIATGTIFLLPPSAGAWLIAATCGQTAELRLQTQTGFPPYQTAQPLPHYGKPLFPTRLTADLLIPAQMANPRQTVRANHPCLGHLHILAIIGKR